MAKKKAAAPEPAGESAPMWIVSFADLVTLLMSFFVVLYATKQGGPQQQMETAAAIASQFGYKPPEDSVRPIDDIVRHRLGLPTHSENNGMGQSPNEKQGQDGSHPDVETIQPGKVVAAGVKITFDSGSTEINAESLAAIDVIVSKVTGLNNVLFIKGHASIDEGALHPDDPNAMDLSYRRALAVADELVKRGIDRRVLRPMACGTFEPVLTGVYDVVGMRVNRRVEVYTTDTTIRDYAPARTVEAGGK